MREENLKRVIELRHELHRYPYLSGEEGKTKKRLMLFLKENTRLHMVDMGKWFYAEYHPANPKGSIALRADMDALKINETTPLPYRSLNPGVSHKCGHDGHSASLAGACMEIDQMGCDKDVYFIFQHAEETGEGGEECAKLLTEKKIDEVYAVHNFPGVSFPCLGIRNETICCASKGMEIHFVGASAHASQPEKGKNPAKAISKIVLALDQIADPIRYSGLILATVVRIDLGERAFGIAAHEGTLCLTIRGQHEQEMLSMQREIEDFSRNCAEEDGLKVDFSFTEEFPETYNHPESTDKIRQMAREKGMPIFEMDAPIRSSEDFGYYTKNTKGAMVWIGAGENHPALHSEDFDFNDRLIPHIVHFFEGMIYFQD